MSEKASSLPVDMWNMPHDDSLFSVMAAELSVFSQVELEAVRLWWARSEKSSETANDCQTS
ncbi:hypothetical protein HO173_004196 [Letharia columbiana]|uniref:Uncharacterized protein n=1 Tax=Letharia columbiana TaxID=112416 RepID=A0A8H6FZZ0_9LECA|nr:uncharacterized protein HO173_004196 [Letharia columbiana]KAF6237995.1 hypothetical protein HO173_004196 [Letharia columbiana]